MNMTFTRILNGGKGVTKYIVFSFIFLLTLFFSANSVGAANTDFPYKGNDSIGASCVASGLADSHLSYTLVSSNYGGSATDCVAYTFTDTSGTHKLFYLQGEDSHILTPNTTNIQTIQFTISASDVGNFTDIAVYEKDSTLGSSVSYDSYSFDGTNYVYKHIVPVGSSMDNDTYWASSGIEKGNFTNDGTTLSFSYALRQPVYGLNTVYINFYDGAIDDSNITKRTQIDFYFAKPISDFSTVAVSAIDDLTCKLGVEENNTICVVYSNQAEATNVAKNINVYFPRNAAFYFSNVNLHSQGSTIANITTYNSLYAINTFSNLNETQVKYYFFNTTDETTYVGVDDIDKYTNDKINVDLTSETSTNPVYYSMYLTMDANGSYVFHLTDVFNKTKETTAITVTDTSVRDIDVYFLEEEDNNDGFLNNGADDTEGAEYFEILSDGSNLTNNNVQIWFEIFYKIKIAEQFGTHDSSSAIIISNPLPSNGVNKELDTVDSYYCKVFITSITGEREYVCLTSSQSEFVENNFETKQEVEETYPGLGCDTDYSTGCIVNDWTAEGAFTQGTINNSGATYVDGINNKANLWVNENGSYSFYIEDTFTNNKEVWIDVSIIDQLQPTMSFGPDIGSSGTKSGTTNLCTSNYVVGANGSYAAAIYGEAGYDADCAQQSVTYDITSGDDDKTDYIKGQSTGKKDSDTRFHLSVNGTNNAKLIYYDYSSNDGTSNDSASRSFNYADAIRIARLTAIDSITSLDSAAATSITTTTKSTYTNTNDTFTTYSLTARDLEDNASIISNNYLQYASELNLFTNDQLRIRISIDGNEITFDDGTNVCNSSANAATCYSIVNNYIDRNIDFVIIFNAIDYVGNISDDYSLSVTVIDDTTPGIMSINNETGAISNYTPVIHMVNIDTTCRLEIGNLIQTKNQLLECYGLLSGTAYNFVDNESGYVVASGSMNRITHAHDNFANALSHQWYRYFDSYDANIKIEIDVDGDGSFETGEEVLASPSIRLDNAGLYKIRFTITDNNVNTGDTSTDTYYNNTTILIAYYYVNPKLLLIAPDAQTIEYGGVTSELTYDVYSTDDKEAFHTNMFELDADELPAFLAKYEIVYSTASTDDQTFLILDNRELAGSLQVIDKGTHDAATENSKSSWTESDYDINTVNSVNAGAYYITLGDIYVNNTQDEQKDSQNYIIRLHPAYLINGEVQDTTLENYDHTDVEENVSSVYLIIKQKILNISANGGSKLYGVVDTNYSYYATVDAVTNTNSKLAYLNGYTIASGDLINTTYSASFTQTDTVSTTYTSNTYTSGGSIIQGVLRREAGEKVGSYSICNDVVRSGGSLKSPNDISGMNCSSSDASKWGVQAAKEISITSLYYYNGTNYVEVSDLSGITIADDALLGYYVKDGSNYYKITADNKNGALLSVYDETWKRTYDGSIYDETEGLRDDDALQVTPNDVNGNRNYVISYTIGTYTINTRNLVIQPGINQGKEYSTPAHSDPIWQIVTYGEVEEYITKATSGFNGYTTDIGLSYSSTTPSANSYDYASGKESEIYFNRRKKAPDTIYLYEYQITATDNVFTLDGVDYKILSGKICRDTGSDSELECYTPTDDVYTIGGLNKVSVSGSVVTVVIEGNLEYQNYTLFMDDTSKTAGKGTIAREAGEIVAWYAFKADLTNLLPVYHNKATTGANYTTSWNDNAPGVETITPAVADGVHKYQYRTTGGNPNVAPYSEGTTTNIYTPNGENTCDNAFYSEPCIEGATGTIKPSSATKNQILFEIFKRDIIISFNYQDEYYGYSYADYKSWYFDFTSTTNATPTSSKGSTMITCYMRASESTATSEIIYIVDGVEYIKASTCSDSDQGLATNDSWGSTSANSGQGLNLEFYLALAEDTTNGGASTFVSGTTIYALPAGMHYVSARIDNDNYRLVYVDYYAVKTATDSANTGSDDSGNGALDIKSSQVTITATTYQKEYGQAIYAKYLSGSTWVNAEINIFDLNYVGCANASGDDNVGCGYLSNTSDAINQLSSTITKNQYDSLANIYGYTVAANSGFIIAGAPTETVEATVIVDTIYNNFYGLPLRDRGNYTGFNASDKYGLLDGAGSYTIDVDDITETFAFYTNNDATMLGVSIPKVGEAAEVSTSSKLMITRYTNYEITTKNTGTLYIIPARIDIEVVDNQTKMYGCAYNGSVSTPVWDDNREDGYSNCDESIADYYDFGYTYKVYGDKTYELLANSSAKLAYDSFSVANTIAAYGSVSDVEYNETSGTDKVASYEVKGIVKTHEETSDYNTITYTVVGSSDISIANSSLNAGVLYRAEVGDTDYSYSTYWGYANDALTKTGNAYHGFQNQSVGEYILTLGNLDVVFNKNNLCNETSDPLEIGSYSCKNFIVYKGDNNTSTHTRSGSTESISNTSLTHEYATVEFEISERTVYLHTEYNYKVYGDTDSLEGFTCAEIASMYTRASGSDYYNAGQAFLFVGRSFTVGSETIACSSTTDTTFVNMGTARYYAVDNSLAKAPWTKWSDDRQGNNASTYYYYDDILWDVIEGLLARTNESGNKSTTYNGDGINDKVGTYSYDWSNIKVTNTYDSDYEFDTLTATTSGTVYDQGFYNEVDSEYQRWYGDTRHVQTSEATVDGYTYHSFHIEDMESEGNYDFTTTKSYGNVYYEVVKREIILVVDNVSKIYGIEDTYALFTVKLCSTYDEVSGVRVCKLLSKEDAYGNRTALSEDDFDYFITTYTSETEVVYNQENIKGYTDATGYGRFYGSETDNESASVRGSFGIYYFREIGEDVGDYKVHACPNQTGTRNNCTSIPAGVSKEYEEGTNGTSYNAANYIITSYTGTLTINKRTLAITPNSGQGFQYGNYESGQKIAPITYYEKYSEGSLSNGANGYNSGTDVNGLVNGAMGVNASGEAISGDSIATQYGLCLFDISSKHQVCLNDRQNSTLKTGAQNVSYTRQYTTGNPTDDMPSGLSGDNLVWSSHNVYNDSYDSDNDTSRMALNRELTVLGITGDRYSRDVGIYTITAGELDPSSYVTCSSSATPAVTTNCLDANYAIGSFTSGVTYEITDATLTLTVTSGQEKIYGQKDVELTFILETSFTSDELPYDYYYCGDSQDDCKQTFAKLGETAQEANATISFKGFAYEEDSEATYNSDGHNYGESRISNKSDTAREVNQNGIEGLRYFDKYCLTGSAGSYVTTFDEFICEGSYEDNGATTTNVQVTYKEGEAGNTSRILLGYLYVEGWAQTQGETHNIRNGIVVADNVYGNKNYELNYAVSSDNGDDTGVDFKINKLELQVSIEDIIKTYGEATDLYKCETGPCNIRTSGDDKLLKALNTENRLEFNFNVVNYGNSLSGSSNLAETGVEGDDSEIRLTNTINGKYYTQTAAAETKNVHLGLTVVRAKEAANGVLCSVNDLFGCEDATTSDDDDDTNDTYYELRFLHSDVSGNVDDNYKVYVGTSVRDEIDTTSDYVAINRTTTTGGVDTQSTFASSDKLLSLNTSEVLAKLIINQRQITFYIGTYTTNELVDERYTIEQNEMLPLMPLIKDTSISYLGGMAKDTDTNPNEKQVYYITWFDNIDPDAVYARQVRTADTISTSYTGDSGLYGIAYCKVPLGTGDLSGITSVDAVTVSLCGDSNVIYADKANTQDANGKYLFDTSVIGTYAIIRDRSLTGVFSNETYLNGYGNPAYEAKNYITTDVNGVLVIYEDATAPTIELPTNMEYTIEANAEVSCTGSGDSKVCTIYGKQVSVGESGVDSLGSAIKYLAQYYSGFDGANNIVVDRGLVDSTASSNGDQFKVTDAGSALYCKKLDDSDCSQLFYPVNNPGVAYSSTSTATQITSYSVLRSANTYNWDDDVIDLSDDDPALRAITSIIAWYNITSYDYGFIRNGEYVTKRYTPRYYIYINGSSDDKLAAFDPRYVGDFTISIYAVDNIGNVSAATTVTLHIKDETKPVSGSMYLFNAPVKCSVAGSVSAYDCANNISDWYVDATTARYIHLNSFVKYDEEGNIDDVNGTYIKIGDTLTSIFSLQRYDYNGTTATKNVSGMYIEALDTMKALEVEHRYWSNVNNVYLVVVGGSDNSYLNLDDIDDAQWENYYKINGNWYEYTRSSKSAVTITTGVGINDVVITAVDSGRVVTSVSQEHSYYETIYLIYQGYNTTGFCDSMNPKCLDADLEATINRQTSEIIDNKFNILGTEFTLTTNSSDDYIVTWGSGREASVSLVGERYSFNAGIVTCYFADENNDGVFDHIDECTTTYDGMYQENDKKTITIDNYTNDGAVGSSVNISDWDTSGDGSDNTSYYRDRKYVYIDKSAGSLTLNSERYKVYEFGCTSCTNTYTEYYVNSSDANSATKGVLSVSGSAITGTATDLAASINALNTVSLTIKGYTGEANKASSGVDTSKTDSGVATFTTSEGTNTYVNVMNGTTTSNQYINYFYTYIRVYLGVRNYGDSDSDIEYYRYTILWNGSSFDVYRVARASNAYATVETYTAATKINTEITNLTSITTIEDLLEAIVISDDALKGGSEGSEYQFDINYSMYDIAGNLSSTLVRGITFVKLSSNIKVTVSETAAANLLQQGNNTYSINVNEGVSFSSLLEGFSINNINNKGENNLSSIKQSLYYNGEALFEGLAYDNDILSIIDGYAIAPGTYTLKLTSTRQAGDYGSTYLVEDTPLVIDFVINPSRALVDEFNDYSNIIVPCLIMSLMAIVLIGFGYVSIKKKND